MKSLATNLAYMNVHSHMGIEPGPKVPDDFTVDEKLLNCSLFHYLGNEWKITDRREIVIDQIKSRFFQ